MTVTLLFTDLVKSTELLSRVGDERMDQLRREHFAILRESGQEYHGHEVKNLGDGLMMAFDGVTNALSCACDMQQRLDMRARVAKEPLFVRIGIATGEASVEDGDYFGVPVVEAARLCAYAEGGEILATAVVRALAGTRSGSRYESIGPVELKGLDEPVDVVRVLWQAPGTRSWQASLPVRLERGATTLFVGRDEERAALSAAASESATERRRRVALVEGEAGIGKTALMSVFAKEAHERGAVVLFGHSDEDLGIPYQAWGEALSELVESAPETMLRAHVEARGGDLLALVPSLRDRIVDVPAPRSADIDAERHLLFGAVVDLLRRASAQAPLVVALDDLHWADRETVQLLHHVIAASVALPMLIVGTFRDTDVGAGHPMTQLLAALHREDGVVRLTLRGLGDDELLRLMEGAAGHDLEVDGRSLRDDLLAETDGNPFFALEILRHLVETGAIVRGADGRWTAHFDPRTQALPVSVREVLGRRIAALGGDAARILSVASVIGRDFDLALLEAATAVDTDVLLDVLDEATHAAIIRQLPERDDSYAFVHALIQHSLYTDMAPARRRRAHERVAAALEMLPQAKERVGEIARHWYEAVQPVSVAKAYAAAIAAGDEARRRLAPSEAARWFAQALDLATQTEQPENARADALLRLGEVQRLAGNAEYRETLLRAGELARLLGDSERLAAAALANTRGFVSVVGQVDEERIGALQAALADANLSAATRARLLAQLSYETHYTPDVDTQMLIDEALAITETLDDDEARAAALRAFHLYFVPSTLERRLATLDEYEALAARGDALRRVRMAMSVVPALFQAARFEDAWSQLDRLRAAAEELGDPSALWVHSWLANIRAMAAGDLVGAEQLATQAFQFGMEAGEPDAFRFFGAQITSVRMAQGRTNEIVDALAQAADDAPGIPVLRAGVALVYAMMGDAERASAMLDEFCRPRLVDAFPESPLRMSALGGIGNVAARVGHAESARALIPVLQPYRDQVLYAGVSLQGPISMALAGCKRVIGDPGAEDDFNFAVALCERTNMPYWLGHTKTDWARLLANGSAMDRLRARDMLKEVQHISHEHGFDEMGRAASELDATLIGV